MNEASIPITGDGESINVSGIPMVVNGVSEVPIGIFGTHATVLDQKRAEQWGVEAARCILASPDGTTVSPGMRRDIAPGIDCIVECMYDRYVPALVISDPENWSENLAALATRYAAAAKVTGRQCHVEFWNEPFLNWAVKPGVNYDRVFYDQVGIEEDAPVRIRSQPEPTEYLVWRRGPWVVDSQTNQPDYIAASYKPGYVGIGGEFHWNGKDYRVEERWEARDRTQIYEFSGQQNRLFYERMLRVFAESTKAENADVKIIAGWGLPFQHSFWQAWSTLYRPLVDHFYDRLDGLSVHYYGWDARQIVGAYEAVTAYTDHAHRVRLPFYMTEAGGVIDSGGSGEIFQPRQGEPSMWASGSMAYTLREIVHCIDLVPDKIIFRGAHQADLNGGDEFAFRLLKPLRGKLVFCHSPWRDVWCVAAVSPERLVVTLFNDALEIRSFPLTFGHGLSFDVNSCVQLTVEDTEDGLKLVERPLTFEPALCVALDSRQGTTLILPLLDAQSNSPHIHIDQYYADHVFLEVFPEFPQRLYVHLPPEKLARAANARLKFVVAAEQFMGKIKVNGMELDPPSGGWTAVMELDLDWLTTNTDIRFESKGSGDTIWCVSIELFSYSQGGLDPV